MIEIHPNALFYHELKYLNKLIEKSKFEPSKVGFGEKAKQDVQAKWMFPVIF